MNSFFTKSSVLVLTFSGMFTVFSSDPLPQPSLSAIADDAAGRSTGLGIISTTEQLSAFGVLDDIRDATVPSPSSMPVQKCVLDFSSSTAILRSTAKIGMNLVSERLSGNLDLLDITYITLEGIAAGARKDPRNFGSMAAYFSKPDAVYDTFGRVIGGMRTAERDLSVLGNINTCREFVSATIEHDLPLLLRELGVNSSDIKQEIALISTPFVPMFAALLNQSYKGISNAAAMVSSVDYSKFNDAVSKCGCFSGCFGSKKKK